MILRFGSLANDFKYKFVREKVASYAIKNCHYFYKRFASQIFAILATPLIHILKHVDECAHDIHVLPIVVPYGAHIATN